MRKFWFGFVRTLQFIWLLPATILVWIFYVLPMWLIFRDLVFVGWAEPFVAEFKLADKNLEKWYVRAWRDWGGWAGPAVIIIRQDVLGESNLERTRKHELRHCAQQFLFGIFHYPFYLLASVFIWLFMPSKSAYLHNPFEIDARKAAGQPVEVPKEKYESNRWPWW